MLKARFLYRDGHLTQQELKEKQPLIHKVLFESKSGHDLNKLSKEIGLGTRHPHAIGGPNPRKKPNGHPEPDACWQRMTRPEVRPYSIRYAEEALSQREVEQEVERARLIVDVLDLEIPRMKR